MKRENGQNVLTGTIQTQYLAYSKQTNNRLLVYYRLVMAYTRTTSEIYLIRLVGLTITAIVIDHKCPRNDSEGGKLANK